MVFALPCHVTCGRFRYETTFLVEGFTIEPFWEILAVAMETLKWKRNLTVFSNIFDCNIWRARGTL